MEDQIAYHLVTRNKMKIGQTLLFNSQNKNNLYYFFFDRVFTNSNGEDCFQILDKLKNEKEPAFSKEDMNVVLKYSDITIKGI